MAELGLTDWVTLLACVGQAALAIVCLVRARKSPLALRLGALCATMFGWNFAFVAYRVTGALEWHVLDIAVAPFTTPLALDFVLSFVGERRRFRWLCRAVYAAFACVALVALVGLAVPEALAVADSVPSTVLQLAIELPAVGFSMVRLAAYARRAGRDERQRGVLILAALSVATVASLSEFAQKLSPAIPRLGGAGTLAAAALMVLAALRFRLLEARLGLGFLFLSLGLGALAVLGYVAVFEALAARTGALVVAVSALTALVVLGARAVAGLHAHGREERERLLFLGRLAAQMAHDLKNPLAALRAMVQYLEVERAEGRSIDGEAPRLALMRGQIDRLTAVIDKYRRLGSVAPVPSEVALDDVVRGVVETARFDSPVAVELELGADLPACRVDADLVAAAVENLVRNAIDAAADAHPEGSSASPAGQVWVRLLSGEDGTRLFVDVSDDGAGMPARVRERVFDDFFTTKAHGSGLGLGFVRRVARTHGGEVEIDTREGRGCTVRLALPASGGPARRQARARRLSRR